MRKGEKSKLEAQFDIYLRTELKGYFCVHQCRFFSNYAHEKRPELGIREALKLDGLKNWVFDYHFPYHKVAVELNGGTYSGGAHVRGKHLNSEYAKIRAAQLLGQTILIYDSDDVMSGFIIDDLKKHLDNKNKEQ